MSANHKCNYYSTWHEPKDWFIDPEVEEQDDRWHRELLSEAETEIGFEFEFEFESESEPELEPDTAKWHVDCDPTQPVEWPCTDGDFIWGIYWPIEGTSCSPGWEP
jgi:hypothetical protein